MVHILNILCKIKSVPQHLICLQNVNVDVKSSVTNINKDDISKAKTIFNETVDVKKNQEVEKKTEKKPKKSNPGLLLKFTIINNL